MNSTSGGLEIENQSASENIPMSDTGRNKQPILNNHHDDDSFNSSKSANGNEKSSDRESSSNNSVIPLIKREAEKFSYEYFDINTDKLNKSEMGQYKDAEIFDQWEIVGSQSFDDAEHIRGKYFSQSTPFGHMFNQGGLLPTVKVNSLSHDNLFSGSLGSMSPKGFQGLQDGIQTLGRI